MIRSPSLAVLASLAIETAANELQSQKKVVEPPTCERKTTKTTGNKRKRSNATGGTAKSGSNTKQEPRRKRGKAASKSKGRAKTASTDSHARQQLRLQRNRDAAQAYRKRKKEQMATLKARIEALERENSMLRSSSAASAGAAQPPLVTSEARGLTSSSSVASLQSVGAPTFDASPLSGGAGNGSGSESDCNSDSTMVTSEVIASRSPVRAATHRRAASTESQTATSTQIVRANPARFLLLVDQHCTIEGPRNDAYDRFYALSSSAAPSLVHGLSPADARNVRQFMRSAQGHSSTLCVFRSCTGSEDVVPTQLTRLAQANSGSTSCMVLEEVMGHVVVPTTTAR